MSCRWLPAAFVLFPWAPSSLLSSFSPIFFNLVGLPYADKFLLRPDTLASKIEEEEGDFTEAQRERGQGLVRFEEVKIIASDLGKTDDEFSGHCDILPFNWLFKDSSLDVRLEEELDPSTSIAILLRNRKVLKTSLMLQLLRAEHSTNRVLEDIKNKYVTLLWSEKSSELVSRRKTCGSQY